MRHGKTVWAKADLRKTHYGPGGGISEGQIFARYGTPLTVLDDRGFAMLCERILPSGKAVPVVVAPYEVTDNPAELDTIEQRPGPRVVDGVTQGRML